MTGSDDSDMQSAAECLARAMAALPRTLSRFAVLQFGFDNFRHVNDALGRRGGDLVLEEAGRRLSASIREFEAAVRLPGDHFAVLLHSVGTVIRAGRAADRLNAILQESYAVLGTNVHLTASVGMALSPEDGDTAEVLLRRAGVALRSAKDVGGGTVQFFEPAMEARRRVSAAVTPADALWDRVQPVA